MDRVRARVHFSHRKNFESKWAIVELGEMYPPDTSFELLFHGGSISLLFIDQVTAFNIDIPVDTVENIGVVRFLKAVVNGEPATMEIYNPISPRWKKITVIHHFKYIDFKFECDAMSISIRLITVLYVDDMKFAINHFEEELAWWKSFLRESYREDNRVDKFLNSEQTARDRVKLYCY